MITNPTVGMSNSDLQAAITATVEHLCDPATKDASRFSLENHLTSLLMTQAARAQMVPQ